MKLRVAKAAFKILAGEAPGKWLAKRGVAFAEGVKSFGEFLNAAVIIRFEYLALDDRKVNFHQVNANAID